MTHSINEIKGFFNQYTEVLRFSQDVTPLTIPTEGALVGIGCWSIKVIGLLPNGINACAAAVFYTTYKIVSLLTTLPFGIIRLQLIRRGTLQTATPKEYLQGEDLQKYKKLFVKVLDKSAELNNSLSLNPVYMSLVPHLKQLGICAQISFAEIIERKTEHNKVIFTDYESEASINSEDDDEDIEQIRKEANLTANIIQDEPKEDVKRLARDLYHLSLIRRYDERQWEALLFTQFHSINTLAAIYLVKGFCSIPMIIAKPVISTPLLAVANAVSSIAVPLLIATAFCLGARITYTQFLRQHLVSPTQTLYLVYEKALSLFKRNKVLPNA